MRGWSYSRPRPTHYACCCGRCAPGSVGDGPRHAMRGRQTERGCAVSDAPAAVTIPGTASITRPKRRRRIRVLLARLNATLSALVKRLDAADQRPAAELLDAEGVAAMLSVSTRSVRAM